MPILEALDLLQQLFDESDPDVRLTNRAGLEQVHEQKPGQLIPNWNRF
jgi:hypothetical protein